jgi:hypothetical protein
MEGVLAAALDKRRKCSKIVSQLIETVANRRKVLLTKISSSENKKSTYYLGEKERDRKTYERSVQEIQKDTELKIEKLKKTYEAQVEILNSKLENKLQKLKEETDAYQAYCDKAMDQAIDEDQDLTLVKYKEELRVAEEKLEKATVEANLLSEQAVKVSASESKGRIRDMNWRMEQEQKDEEEKQRKIAKEREATIRLEVEKNKEANRKIKESIEEEAGELVRQQKLQEKKEKQWEIDRKIREYYNAIYMSDRTLFNKLTIKEKLEIIESQKLYAIVKEYEDKLIDEERSDFKDLPEIERYRKAVGDSVLSNQKNIIKKYSDKYEDSDSESDSPPAPKQQKQFSNSFDNQPKILMTTRRPKKEI